MNASRSSDPVRLPDKFGHEALKVGLVSDPIGLTLGAVAFDAVVAYYGGVKQAAYALGEGAQQSKLDPSLMARELKAGDFRRLDQFGDAGVKAAVSAAHATVFGPLPTPKARMESLLELRDRVDRELDQFLREFVS